MIYRAKIWDYRQKSRIEVVFKVSRIQEYIKNVSIENTYTGIFNKKK